MYRGRTIGVVVPAFNEERFIGEVLDTMPSFVDRVVVVDDASTDGTNQIVSQALEGERDRIKLVRHDSRQGVGASIKTGYKELMEEGVEIVAVMAGDGQMDPEHLPRLLDPIIEDQADYAKGNRLLSLNLKEMPKTRIRGNALLTFLTKIASGYYDVMDPQNGYTTISRKALLALDLDRVYDGYGYCNEILIQLNELGLRVVDVDMPPRYRGEKSKIKIGRYSARLSWLLIHGFFRRIFRKYLRPRIHPILLFFISSFILIPAGLILGLVVLSDRLTHGGYAIGTVLLATLLLILGTQSLCFGMFFDAMKSGYGVRTTHSRQVRLPSNFFSRLRKQYLGINFHPLGLFYLVAILLLVIGIFLGIIILHGKILTGGISLGSVTLDLLLIVVASQLFFFAMLFEAEAERFLE